MLGLIVAAGQGSRLRERAPSKPLAQVQGEPLISRVISCALEGGCDRFVVVTGYEAPRLEAFLARLAQIRGAPITCVRNPDWREGNGLSVAAAAEVLPERFALLMADHLFDPAILRGLAEAAGEGDLTLAVDRRLDNPLVDLDDVTRVRTSPEGRILAIGKGLADYDAFDTGLFVAGRGLIEAIREEARAGRTALSHGVQRLADQGRAGVHDIGERFWLDVDDAAALDLAQKSAPQVA